MPNQNDIKLKSMLRKGTMLHGTYRIDDYLSSGGFGNTYVATHVSFGKRYAIKEFFMDGVNERDNNSPTVKVSNDSKVNEFTGQPSSTRRHSDCTTLTTDTLCVCTTCSTRTAPPTMSWTISMARTSVSASCARAAP